MKLKLKSNNEYTPREIAENGWILNVRENASYEYILALIRDGLLPARDIRRGRPNRREGKFDHRKYWLVRGSDIRQYNKINKAS